MNGEIKAVLLDINGTVFDAKAASVETFKDLGIDIDLFSVIFAEILRDAFAAQAAGVFTPFRDFAGHHLARRIHQLNPESSIDALEAGNRLAQAWSTSAEPFPDVAKGLNKLLLAGITIAAMTNGSREIATNVFKKAGLGGKDVAVYDINEAKAWKPSSEAYNFACNALGMPPKNVMMVASHPWDCHGALQAGMQAAYVQRDPSEPYFSFLDAPAMCVQDFNELADKLLLEES